MWQEDEVGSNVTGVPGLRKPLPWRGVACVALLSLYVLLTLAVIYPTPMLTFDGWLRGLHLKHNNPAFATPINIYVLFGQRGPSTLVFLPFFFWIAWRERSSRPLVMLGTALVLLNVSVGIVKLVTGRIGPFDSTDTHEIFSGGNIYPSGHVSNVVVLYGLIAWLAPRYRRSLVAVAVWLSVTVGLGTVYLRTHWISDVFGGWVAGALVLVALPWVMPYSQRFVDHIVTRVRARRARWHRHVPSRPAGPRAAHPVARTGHVTVMSTAASNQRLSATPAYSEADDPTRTRDRRVSPIASCL